MGHDRQYVPDEALDAMEMTPSAAHLISNRNRVEERRQSVDMSAAAFILGVRR